MKPTTATLLGISLLAVAACASTQRSSVERSNLSWFLADARGMMREGRENEAQLIYRRSGVNWSAYRRVLLEPVRVIASKDSAIAEASKQDRQAMATWAYKAFASSLHRDFELVQTPGPNTLRVQLAVTEAYESRPVLDTVTSVIPQARTVATITELVSGSAPFVGGLSGEAKITDSLTGALLQASADSRQGTKNLSGLTNSWIDVEKALQYFAEGLAYNLCQLQKRGSCMLPKA